MRTKGHEVCLYKASGYPGSVKQKVAHGTTAVNILEQSYRRRSPSLRLVQCCEHFQKHARAYIRASCSYHIHELATPLPSPSDRIKETRDGGGSPWSLTSSLRHMVLQPLRATPYGFITPLNTNSYIASSPRPGRCNVPHRFSSSASQMHQRYNSPTYLRVGYRSRELL
jgi:hypothetical protein